MKTNDLKLSMLRTLKTLAIAILLIIIALFLYPWVLRGLGYYVDATGSEVAEIAVQKKDVSLCKKITVYARFMGPTAGSRIRECIYTYAELTKDPTACELLIPSDYGFSCLGGAQESPDACNVDFGKSVSWKTGDGPTDWAEATLDECLQDKEKSESGKKCCHIMRLSHEPAVNDCSPFSADRPFMNSCLLELAMKKRDEKLCAPIDDENKRLICEIQTRNLRK